MDNMVYGSILKADVVGVNDLNPKLELSEEEREALANISSGMFHARSD